MAKNGFSKYSTTSNKGNNEPSYKILQRFGSLTDNEGGWNKELNLISWNDNEPKFDLRAWKTTEKKGTQMMKGITLNAEEIEALYQLLKRIAEDSGDTEDVEVEDAEVEE